MGNAPQEPTSDVGPPSIVELHHEGARRIDTVRAALTRWIASGASLYELPASAVRFALDCRGCEATRVGVWDALMAVSDECEDCHGEGSHCDDSHPGNAAVQCERCDGHGRVAKGIPTTAEHTSPEGQCPYSTWRADGWPQCPSCGEDELYSLANPATVETIVGCYYCRWQPPDDGAHGGSRRDCP